MKNYYNEEILKLISDEILDLSIEELKVIYMKFQNEEYEWISSKDTKGVFNSFLSLPSVYHRQFDLPYVIPSKQQNHKTIIILGMDALASSDRPEDDEILLNTPYNLHSKQGRETKVNQYWDIINDLRNDYNLYLTDIFKSYFRNPSKSNEIEAYTDLKAHQEILEAEINIVKPEGILAWGKPAREAIITLYNLPVNSIGHNRLITKDDIRKPYYIDKIKTKFISTPHPSGLTRPAHWRSFYQVNLPEKDSTDHHSRPSVLSNLITSSFNSNIE